MTRPTTLTMLSGDGMVAVFLLSEEKLGCSG